MPRFGGIPYDAITDVPTRQAFRRLCEVMGNMFLTGKAAERPTTARLGAYWVTQDAGQEVYWYAGESIGWLLIASLTSAGQATLDHNLLKDLQGGLSEERYHLASAEHTALVANHPFSPNAVLYADADGYLATDPNFTYQGGQLVFGQHTNIIRTDSVDGSDTKRIIVASASAPAGTRGAYLQVFGNEYGSGYSGSIALLPGDSNEGGTFSDKVWVGGDALVPFTAGAPTLGTPALYWKRLLTAAGSAAAPAVAAGPYPTTGLYFPAANQVGISCNGSSAWYWDASGHFLPGSPLNRNIGSASAEIGNVYVGNNKCIYLGSSQNASIKWDTTNNRLEIKVP